jgi:hypothetical protein
VPIISVTKLKNIKDEGCFFSNKGNYPVENLEKTVFVDFLPLFKSLMNLEWRIAVNGNRERGGTL